MTVFDLDFGVKIDSVELQIKRKCMGSGYVSYCLIFAFDDHLNDHFVVLKDQKQRIVVRKFCF